MQVTTVQTTPAAPAAPAAPLPPLAPAGRPTTVTFTGVDGASQTLQVPLSRREVSVLRSRRTELSNQLTSAASRRHRLSEEIRSAPDGASRKGLEDRISVLDKRIIQLESDIAATGLQLSAAPQGLAATTSTGGAVNDIPDNVFNLSVVFMLFVLFPIAFTFARNLWKRGNKQMIAPLPADVAQRLERVEQGVDAIAIEIERVTEGQRFVTRLLSEGNPAALKLGESAHAEEARTTL